MPKKLQRTIGDKTQPGHGIQQAAGSRQVPFSQRCKLAHTVFTALPLRRHEHIFQTRWPSALTEEEVLVFLRTVRGWFSQLAMRRRFRERNAEGHRGQPRITGDYAVSNDYAALLLGDSASTEICGFTSAEKSLYASRTVCT